MSVGIPAWTTVWLAVGALVCCAGPVAALAVCCKRWKCSAAPGLLGALAYLVAIALESRAVALLIRIPPLNAAIASSAVCYALFYCLMAGLFEETARLGVLYALRERHQGTRPGLVYGIGHGGCEAVLLVGIPYALSLLAVLWADSAGLEGAARSLGVSPEAFAALGASPSSHYLAGVVERCSAVALHLANSLLLWLAVTRQRLRLLYPAAVGTHLLVNLGVGFYQAGAIHSVWGVELYTAVMAAAVCLLARQVLLISNRSHTELPRYRPV